MTAGPARSYARPMRPALLAATLLLPAADGPGLTTEALHSRSPLAAALNVRVREPEPLPTLPDGGDAPAWRRVLAPRSASGLFTSVVGDDLNTTEFDVRTTHGLRGAPPFVTLSPGLNLLLTDGPDSDEFAGDGSGWQGSAFGDPDLPGALWAIDAELMAFMPLSEKWSAQVAAAPGIFTDFENTAGDAFRIPGRALAIYKRSPRATFTLGAVFLDRDDVRWVPAVGGIFRPTDRTTLELVLPRPRVSHRFWGDSPDDGGFGYLAGEYGGASWAVRRTAASGRRRDDVATLSDFRLLAGFEAKRAGGTGWLAETGYVFDRGVEYKSGRGDEDFGDAWLFRVGVRK